MESYFSRSFGNLFPCRRDGGTVRHSSRHQVLFCFAKFARMLHLLTDALNSFGSLPTIRHLEVEIYAFDPFPGFNLNAFSNLSSLTIIWRHTVNIKQDFVDDIADLISWCPNLERFTFSIPPPSRTPLAGTFICRLAV